MNAALTQALQHLDAPYAWVELFSMTSALLGSLVLALKGKYSGWGWVLFAFSNVGWIVFAQGYGHWFFLVQQIGFSITSAIGILNYLVWPKRQQHVGWRRVGDSATVGGARYTEDPYVAQRLWLEHGCTVQALAVVEEFKP